MGVYDLKLITMGKYNEKSEALYWIIIFFYSNRFTMLLLSNEKSPFIKKDNSKSSKKKPYISIPYDGHTLYKSLFVDH